MQIAYTGTAIGEMPPNKGSKKNNSSSELEVLLNQIKHSKHVIVHSVSTGVIGTSESQYQAISTWPSAQLCTLTTVVRALLSALGIYQRVHQPWSEGIISVTDVPIL